MKETNYIYGAGLLAMVTPANEVYTYHYNAIGNTIAMTDQTQAIVNKYAYDEFGNILNQQETISQPFKFVGQHGVMTEPNGFYYMKARYYDPNVGRFISEDPIGFEGGDVNLMAYASNNPLLNIDPTGFCSESQQSRNWLENVSDFSAGFGDTITFGGTKWIREQIGVNDVVNSNSGYYTAGEVSGYAWWTATGTASAARTAVTTTVKTRAAAGADGAISQIIKTKSQITNRTIEVIHRVTKDGKVIHQNTKFKNFWPF